MCKKSSLETGYIFTSDTVEWDWGHKQNLLGARTATARRRWGCAGVSERTSEKAQDRPGREHKVRACDQASRLPPMVLHSIYVTSLQQIIPRGRAWKKHSMEPDVVWERTSGAWAARCFSRPGEVSFEEIKVNTRGIHRDLSTDILFFSLLQNYV